MNLAYGVRTIDRNTLYRLVVEDIIEDNLTSTAHHHHHHHHRAATAWDQLESVSTQGTNAFMPLQEAGSYHGGCFTAMFSTMRLQDELAHAACVEETKPKDGCYKATSMVDWKCKHCWKREDQHFGPPDQRLCRDPEEEGGRQAAEEAESKQGQMVQTEHRKQPIYVRPPPSKAPSLAREQERERQKAEFLAVFNCNRSGLVRSVHHRVKTR